MSAPSCAVSVTAYDHIVVEYAQALDVFLSLGGAGMHSVPPVQTSRRQRNRRKNHRSSRPYSVLPLVTRAELWILTTFAGNLTVGRLHFACLAAENDRAAQLGLVQRNAGCLDDDNTGYPLALPCRILVM